MSMRFGSNHGRNERERIRFIYSYQIKKDRNVMEESYEPKKVNSQPLEYVQENR